MQKPEALKNILSPENESSSSFEMEPIQISLRLATFLIAFLLVMIAILALHYGSLILFLLPLFILAFIGWNSIDHPFTLSSIKIRREFSQIRVTELDEVEVKLIVTNTGNLKAQIVEIEDIISSENIEISKGSNLFLISLKPNETITVSYFLKAHFIGVFTFSEVELRYRDFLGLYTIELNLNENNSPGLEKTLYVVPRLEKIVKIPFIKTQWLHLYNGYFTSKQSGHDSDFYGIKKYEYGDVLTRINWKATARWQKILSNEYNWDKSLTTEIIFDSLPSSRVVWINQVRAVISLTDFFVRMRNKLGFTTIATYPYRLKARVGKRQLLEITNYLITSNVDPNIPSPLIYERVVQKASTFDPNAVIFFVSSFMDQIARDYAFTLKKRGFTVIAIIPLALKKQAREIALLNKREIESHDKIFFIDEIVQKLIIDYLLLEKNRLRTILKINNIPFIEWDTSKHFGNLLQHIRYI